MVTGSCTTMINMSPESLEYLESAVAQGAYPNTGAALDEAVRLLQRRDHVRRQVHAGAEQADRGELIPAEQVFARLERRALEIQQSAQQSQ
jgi:antitoxin ParD1/3/4